MHAGFGTFSELKSGECMLYVRSDAEARANSLWRINADDLSTSVWQQVTAQLPGGG